MNVPNTIESLGQLFPSDATSTSVVRQTVQGSQSEGLTADQTTVSSTASQVAVSANEPEVRMDKVASIQSVLLSGTYQVSASDVADKLIQTMTAEGQ